MYFYPLTDYDEGIFELIEITTYCTKSYNEINRDIAEWCKYKK